MRLFYCIFLLFLVSCSTTTTKNEAKVLGTSQSEADKKRNKDTQKWNETSKWIDDSQKLEAVSSKIFLGGATYCENLKHVRSYIGVRAWSRHAFDKQWQEMATSRFGLGDEVQIYLVNPGSPADKAGVKVRDVVLSVNGRPIHKGAKAVEQFEEEIRGIQAGEAVYITLRRGNEQHDVSVTPSIACKGQVILTEDNSFSSNVDGEKIKISKGLMNFFAYDEEMMAAVISHELVHSLGAYNLNTKMYAYLFAFLYGTVGLSIDIAVLALTHHASNAFTEAFTHAGLEAAHKFRETNSELQAHYIGLHIMAMAGYDIDRAPGLWQQLANNPEAENMMNRHFTSTNRISEIDEAINKVKSERLQNIQLIQH